MKTYNNLYEEICSINNLANAWKKARKGKLDDYSLKARKAENLSDNEENTPPEIEIIGLSLVSIPAGSVYNDAGATAHDNEDGDTVVIGVGGVNTNVAGDYVITYNHTDTGGLSAPEVTRNVTVTPYPQCTDGSDNDEDGFNDNTDPQCHSDGNAQNQASYDPEDNNESGPITECNDSIDNDQGEDTDAQDPQCHTDGDLENLASYDSSINSESGVVDVCPNIEGNQSTVPNGKEIVDSQCLDIPAPVTPPTTPPSGGGGGGNGPIVGTFGVVNGGGSSSTGIGQVLGESCGLYMNKYLRLGSRKNDSVQVKKLQEFLNKNTGASLPVTGFYGQLTSKAVKNFQEKYKTNILDPWGLNSGTGLVYISTLRQINNLECPDIVPVLPTLIPWSQNPNVQ